MSERPRFVTLAAADGSTRTVCEVCGISVLISRREEYGRDRCRLHRTRVAPLVPTELHGGLIAPLAHERER